MSLTEFIKQNKEEIKAHIREKCPNATRFDKEELRQWVYNAESLYLWARSVGVNI